MLFDLRSKSRRRVVKVIYVILALIMLSGLLLVGVGTGNNNGGILNALGTGGSGTAADSAIQTALNNAIKSTKKHPSVAANWDTLMTTRWSAAGNGTNFDSTNNTYTKGGKAQLALAVTAWDKYLSLTSNKPSLGAAVQAAKVYQALEQWTGATTAWQFAIQAAPASSPYVEGYVCTALNLYAAKQKSTGNLGRCQGHQADHQIRAASAADRLQTPPRLRPPLRSSTSRASADSLIAASDV